MTVLHGIQRINYNRQKVRYISTEDEAKQCVAAPLSGIPTTICNGIQSKKNYHEDKEKNVIRSLNKLDTLYNPDYFNYINDKFKGIKIEDESQEKALIH